MKASPLQLNSAPAAGFDAPFEMLAACHERVERSLRLLERLAEHLRTQGADAQARGAAQDVLRYFDLAAPQHHEDEERHLLPLLRAHGRGELAARIETEHRAMAAAWAVLRRQLQAVARGDGGIADAPEARRDWPAFVALYRRHLALEDDELFPTTRAWVDAPAQRAMGDEMASRRAVATPR